MCYGSTNFIYHGSAFFGESFMHAPVVLIIGTRPEGIKLLPLYFALQHADIPTFICSTAQHSELLSEVFEIFGVTPDVSLNIMRPGQDLFYVTQSVLQKTKELFMQINPSLVVVQGDTTSGMAAALAAFYLKVPVAHVEAGLRTDDIHAPFPEEMNRRVLRVLSSYHFAPTSWSAAQLLSEGVEKKNVFCLGNTVVDALRLIGNAIDNEKVSVSSRVRSIVERTRIAGQRLMLFTMHRRESFDGGIQRVLHTYAMH
jgi:UDP-N-acetylglucosamine 2-epimerase (non-hydrolysing)